MRPDLIGCTSFSFPALPLRQSVGVIAALGLWGIDLCIAHGERDVRRDDVVADPVRIGAQHRVICDAMGLRVDDVFAHFGDSPAHKPINTADPILRANNRETLVRYLDYAQAAGSPGVTMSPGVTDREHPREAYLRAVDELRWACDLARSRDVAFSIEPHLDSVAADPTVARQLCADVPDLTITLDYSHFVAGGFASGEVHSLFAHARHAHIRQARLGRLQCSVASGEIDIVGMMRAADDFGYEGTFALEFVHTMAWGMNDIDVITETARLRDQLFEAIA